MSHALPYPRPTASGVAKLDQTCANNSTCCNPSACESAMTLLTRHVKLSESPLRHAWRGMLAQLCGRKVAILTFHHISKVSTELVARITIPPANSFWSGQARPDVRNNSTCCNPSACKSAMTLLTRHVKLSESPLRHAWRGMLAQLCGRKVAVLTFRRIQSEH